MSESTVLISCPVYKRAWVLPLWLECIEKLNYPKDKLGFIFELGPDDDETHQLLWEYQLNHPEHLIFDGQIFMRVKHNEFPEGERHWGGQLYENMATLRNNLLERARSLDKFDYYLSLDSDILLEDPDSLRKLIAVAKDNDDKCVVSPLSYMTPMDTNFPSAMTWETPIGAHAVRKLEEYKIGEVFKADIVMAVVLMPKEIYFNVNYQWHPQGEDLGFARDLRRLGYFSMAAWHVYCPHLMHRFMADWYQSTHIDGRNPFLVI